MKKDKPTIKILCCYHKKDKLYKNDIVVPIHVGRAIAKKPSKDGKISEKDYKWLLKNMIGDDTGENISHLNRHFNELTAIYWAWKNYDKLGNPDFIGLMHYRRLFNFTKTSKSNPSLKDLGITYENIDLKENTCIFPSVSHNTEANFEPNQKIFNLSDNYYPNLYSSYLKFNKDKLIYFSNMFILPKEVFFDYCKTIFDLTFKACDEYGIYHFRTRYFGFMGEFLTSFYFMNLINQNKFEIKEYPKIIPLYHIFKENIWNITTNQIIKLKQTIDLIKYYN